MKTKGTQPMQDVQIQAAPDASPPQSGVNLPGELRPTPLPLRNDTILGVCEAIGTDFGFHPNWLRVAFAGATYINPVAVVAIYLALGIVVAVSRWLAPAARATAAAPQLATANQAPQDNQQAAEKVPLAA